LFLRSLTPPFMLLKVPSPSMNCPYTLHRKCFHL
jgi:hypothetical protein